MTTIAVSLADTLPLTEQIQTVNTDVAIPSTTWTTTASPTSSRHPVSLLTGQEARPKWVKMDASACTCALSSLGCEIHGQDVIESLGLTEDLTIAVVEGCPVFDPLVISSAAGQMRHGTVYFPSSDTVAPTRLVMHFGPAATSDRLSWADSPYTSFDQTGPQIGTTSGSGSYDAALWAGPNGQVFILYRDENGSGDVGIAFRVATFTASAYTLGTPITLETYITTPSQNILGSVAYDATNDIVWVVYARRDTVTGNWDVKLRKSTDQGASFGSAILVDTVLSASNFTQSRPYIALVQGTKLVVSWHYLGSSRPDDNVRLRAYVSEVFGSTITCTNLSTVGDQTYFAHGYPHAAALGVLGNAGGALPQKYVEVALSGAALTEGSQELVGVNPGSLAAFSFTSVSSGKIYAPVVRLNIGPPDQVVQAVRSAAGVWTTSSNTDILPYTPQVNTPSCSPLHHCTSTVYAYTGPGSGDPNQVLVFSEVV